MENRAHDLNGYIYIYNYITIEAYSFCSTWTLKAGLGGKVCWETVVTVPLIEAEWSDLCSVRSLPLLLVAMHLLLVANIAPRTIAECS